MSKMIWNAWRSPFFFLSLFFIQFHICTERFICNSQSKNGYARCAFQFSFGTSMRQLFDFVTIKSVLNAIVCDSLFLSSSQSPKVNSLKLVIVILVSRLFEQKIKCYVTRVYNLISLIKSKKTKKRNKCSKMIETNSNKRNVFVRALCGYKMS